MNPSLEHLSKTLQLLEIERDEERTRYREKFLHTSIEDRKKEGLTWYPVVLNEWEIGLGERLVLELERSEQENSGSAFSSGSVVALFSNADPNRKEKPAVNGVVISVKRNKIRLALEGEDLPDWIDDGKLGIDLYFDERTYRVMSEAVEAVMAARGDRLAELREVLTGHSRPSFRSGLEALILPGLNPSQNEALAKIAASQDLALVHGPPGTGKTTTLVRAVAFTLKTEKQVLVCAASNLAVDLLTERLSQQNVSVIRLGHPARLTEAVLAHSLDQQIATHDSYRDLRQLRKDAEAIRRQALKFKRKFGAQERQQRKELLREARDRGREARQMEDYILGSLLGQASVIACTLTGAATSLLRDRHFSTVFIDEAAQALEPACWVAIRKADRVVLAGDHCQLPPTVKSAKAAREGLMQTLFEQAIQHHPHAAVLLRTQYRMHRQIMEFSSRQFYEDRLEADASVAEALLELKQPDEALQRPLQFIDTAGCGFDDKLDPESLSHFNPGEAELSLKILAQLSQQLSTPANTPLSVGLIAPYKAQVRLIRELMEQVEPDDFSNLKIRVDTVDGFQGQERDIMLISLVRSNDRGEIGFLSDIRRMNVAMTRARRKLIVIGDSATLAKHSFYQAFMDYVEECQAYQSAWEYMY